MSDSVPTVVLGGMTFELKPTPIAKMLRLLPLLAATPTVGGMPIVDEPMAIALGEAIFHGIRRAGGKGREITQDWVHDNIDATNIEAIMEVFTAVNVLERKASNSGEAQAGAAS